MIRLPNRVKYLAIKPDDVHHARTKLLCLENITADKVLPKAHNKAGLLRLVTHLDVNSSDIKVVIAAIKNFYQHN